MNYVENSKQYEALKRWLAAENFTVFGTLKFPSKYPISEYKAQRLVCNFFKKLDRAYYGSAAENIGMRHNRVVFKHMGTSGANLHYHFLAKPHTDPALFAELARKQWANMGTWTTDYVDTDIKAVRSNEGASNYMLHEYYKLGADCVFLQASALKAPKHSPLKYRNIQQMRKLLAIKNLSTNEIEYGANDDDALYSI